MTTAIFPGSFDPVTLGHVDLIKRARKLCEHLIVAVAVNPDKQGSFTMEERMSMIRGALDGADHAHLFRGSALDVSHDITSHSSISLLMRSIKLLSPRAL